MSNRITNSITFICDASRLEEILATIQDPCSHTRENTNSSLGTIDFKKIIPILSDSPVQNTWGSGSAYDFSYDNEGTIEFLTKSSPPLKIIEALATEMFPDITINYAWYGDYYTGASGSALFEKGELVFHKYHKYCDMEIIVPEQLGYPNNLYLSTFAPEEFKLDRTNIPEVAKFMLEDAIKSPYNNPDIPPGPRTPITDKIDFDQALAIAIDSFRKGDEIQALAPKSIDDFYSDPHSQGAMLYCTDGDDTFPF